MGWFIGKRSIQIRVKSKFVVWVNGTTNTNTSTGRCPNIAVFVVNSFKTVVFSVSRYVGFLVMAILTNSSVVTGYTILFGVVVGFWETLLVCFKPRSFYAALSV